MEKIVFILLALYFVDVQWNESVQCPLATKGTPQVCVKILDKLFVSDELRQCVLLPTRRSSKPTLDKDRVEILVAVTLVSKNRFPMVKLPWVNAPW